MISFESQTLVISEPREVALRDELLSIYNAAFETTGDYASLFRPLEELKQSVQVESSRQVG